MVPINRYINLIGGSRRVNFPYCYCVLVLGGTHLLIDSGCSSDQAGWIREQGLDIVVNTHFHMDHVYQNQNLGPVEVWCHSQDAPAIRSMDAHLDLYGLQYFAGPIINQAFLDNYPVQAGPVHRELKDGERLDFGEVCFQVIHTPGHSPGHCALYEEKSDILILGDIELSSFGPWYGSRCSSLDNLIASIEKCMEIDAHLVISGHLGLIDKNLRARFLAYRDRILKNEEKIWQGLEIPATLNELAGLQVFYGPRMRLNQFRLIYEKWAVYHHLQRLINLGRVKKEGEYFFRV